MHIFSCRHLMIIYFDFDESNGIAFIIFVFRKIWTMILVNNDHLNESNHSKININAFALLYLYFSLALFIFLLRISTIKLVWICFDFFYDYDSQTSSHKYRKKAIRYCFALMLSCASSIISLAFVSITLKQLTTFWLSCGTIYSTMRSVLVFFLSVFFFFFIVIIFFFLFYTLLYSYTHFMRNAHLTSMHCPPESLMQEITFFYNNF